MLYHNDVVVCKGGAFVEDYKFDRCLDYADGRPADSDGFRPMVRVRRPRLRGLEILR